MDLLASRLFGQTPAEAHALGRCVRCKRPVAVLDLADRDRAEYLKTALCPQCWDDIFPQENEE